MKNLDITIFTDFDGTITKVDTLNIVLDRFASKPWRPIEDLVSKKKLPENKALQAEFDLVNASFEEVINYLNQRVQIDPYFIQFAEWCNGNKIPLIILSGGFREIIEFTFEKFNIKNNMEIRSNNIKVQGNRWTVIPSDSPRINKLCNHCKTYHLAQVKNKGKKTVFIGDGNTDRCPAESADIIFAKNDLAGYLTTIKMDFYYYENFSDILKILTGLITDNIS